MKLKLNTGGPNTGASSASSPPPNPTPTAERKIRLSLGDASTLAQPGTSPATAQPKIKKPTGGTKRPREDDQAEPPPKKRASGGTINFAKVLQDKNRDTSSNPNSPKTPLSAIPSFRLSTNKKGKPPLRPLGVGYDSEAEDAEEDPALEENVILRMEEGEDCNYLRNAITQGKVGINFTHGGAEVYMRFFRDRRAAIVIQGRVYAAILVDLPCIIESMKSWDKRGWWKSADICQMLLVIGRVSTEAEAQTASVPREIDQKNWQYPHGLTPPMYNVRKRRFRKRVSFKTIEAAEDEVERLINLDNQIREEGGRTEAQIVDLDRSQSQEVSSEGEDEDAAGELDEDMDGAEQYDYEEDDEEDPEALAARMAAELAGDDFETAVAKGVDASQAADTASQLVAAQAAIDQSGASVDIPNGVSDDDDDDDDDGDADNNAGMNEEDQEQAQLKAQQREEAADLQREIEKVSSDFAQAGNPMIKQRFERRLDALRKELASKKRSLGEDPDE